MELALSIWLFSYLAFDRIYARRTQALIRLIAILNDISWNSSLHYGELLWISRLTILLRLNLEIIFKSFVILNMILVRFWNRILNQNVLTFLFNIIHRHQYNFVELMYLRLFFFTWVSYYLVIQTIFNLRCLRAG